MTTLATRGGRPTPLRLRVLIRLSKMTFDKGLVGLLVGSWALNRADVLRERQGNKQVLTPRWEHRRNVRARKWEEGR